MAKTKNIIFDLGGVILNINYNKTKDAFIRLGYSNFEEMYNQYSADALFENLETGKISNEAFYKQVIEQHKGALSPEQVRGAWNSMLLDFRPKSLEFLKQLAQGYQLYLLSNTNAIHMEAFKKLFSAQTGYLDLDAFFTKAYYSNEVNLRKPNADIFEYVLKDAGILAEETLFVDDSFNNIDAAKELGFKTHLLLEGEKIQDLNYEL